MKEELLKEIEVQKEVLSTLPKNNKKNIGKYVETLEEEITKYKELSQKVQKEMIERKEKIEQKVPTIENKDLTEKVEQTKKDLNFLNEYNTPFEKMHIDEILYLLVNEANTYESINSKIKELIAIFKEVGVTLKFEDFKFSPAVHGYMTKFFANIEKNNTEELNKAFEKLFWKESDIITHIEVSFKHLYYKYKKYFDKYCKIKQLQIKLKNPGIIKEHKRQIRENELEKRNIYNVYQSFINKNLNPGEYTKDKIDQVFSDYIDINIINENNYTKIIEEFSKLKNTLEEYYLILKYEYIIKDIRNLYKEKDKYKNITKLKLKEISKEEKKAIKISNKVYCLKKRKNKEEQLDKLYLEFNNEILAIKKLYDELETEKINEEIGKFTDNTDLRECLYLANSYYIYQDKLAKKQNEENTKEMTTNIMKEIEEFIIRPNNTLINNICIVNEKDIKHVIKEKYMLSSINIKEESLEDENTIELVITDTKKILTYDVINKSNITPEEIIYVCEINNLLQ